MDTGIYEAWASRLVAWGNDPETSLEGLPVLTEESFGSSTFQRLFKHLQRAQEKLMQRWKDDWEEGLDAVQNEHDLAQLLVHSRELLAKRVQLASHPGLPAQVREALLEETTTAIKDIQAQLEKGLSAHTNSWAVEDGDLLRAVRATPLTAVLDPGFNNAANPLIQAIDAVQGRSGVPGQAALGSPGHEVPATNPGFVTRVRRHR